MTEARPIARGSAIPAVDFDRLAHWLTTSTDQVFRTLRRETRHVGGQRYAFIAGYYRNHSLQAFVQLDETISQVERFARFTAAHATHRFPHQSHVRH